jgi:hypothetical protein
VLAAAMRDLLAWQRTLRGWPRRFVAPDGTPFVSVYSNGELRGCYASNDGAPCERIARAFLLAAHDGRFGGLVAERRTGAVALVAYAHDLRPIDARHVVDRLEIGTHGLLYLRNGGGSTMLLPQVARDRRFDAAAFVHSLETKARSPGLEDGKLFTFETTEISSLGSRTRKRAPMIAAGDHLASLVERDGAITFAVHPRSGARTPIGAMHHGRSAVVVQALAALGRKSEAERARRRLERDIEGALSAQITPQGWPEDDDRRAGTLALAALAGIDLRAELSRAKPQSAWHGAQVVAALGKDAPKNVYSACIADLDARPWAPWTLIAAHAAGDARTAKRIARTLVASVRSEPPHEGGVTPPGGRIPEIALTSLVVEALAAETDRASRAAVDRARRFLLRWQVMPPHVRGPVDLDVAAGAFPLSPVDDGLRCDVTAHAVLALHT